MTEELLIVSGCQAFAKSSLFNISVNLATALWHRWQPCCSCLPHCGPQVLVALGRSTCKCTVWHLGARAAWWSMLLSLCPRREKFAPRHSFFPLESLKNRDPLTAGYFKKSLQSRGRVRLWKARVISSNNSPERMNYMFIKVNTRPGPFK